MAGAICPRIGNRSSGIVCMHAGWYQTEKRGVPRGWVVAAGVLKSKGWGASRTNAVDPETQKSVTSHKKEYVYVLDGTILDK